MNTVSYTNDRSSQYIHYLALSIVMHLRHLSVQSSFKHKLPKSLVIAACNLTLGKTIGQGMT